MILRIFTILFFLSFPIWSYSQSDSLNWEQKFAQLEAEMDSLSIFYLLDSVLSDYRPKYSELNTRLSYNSDVLSAGRNFGLDQKTVSPGVSFYHSSGFYGDYTGFIDTDSTFDYSLSIFTLGYLLVKNKWSLTPTYERWWYYGSSNTLNNSIGTTLSYTNKIGYVALDYSYLFGQESAHRIIGSINGYINLGKWWKFRKVKLIPSFSTFFGNSDVTVRFDGSLQEAARSGYQLQNIIQSAEFRDLVREELSQQDLFRVKRITESKRHSPAEKYQKLTNIFSNYPNLYEALTASITETDNVYGIMNYNFSLPLFLQTERFTYVLNYSYSIPVALPGETTTWDNTSYFGASVTYRIPFNNK